MSKYKITGGNRINGEINIHGSKNATIPILAATLLAKESILYNCPSVIDTKLSCDMLRALNCSIESNGTDLYVKPNSIGSHILPDSLMRDLNGSIIFCGAMLARYGMVRTVIPGGCEIGARPIDIHLKAFKRLGAEIVESAGCIDIFVKDRLRGAEISLDFPSVGATENTLLVACTAEGETIISNAAREPEVEELINYLNSAGAKIHLNKKDGNIYITGVDELEATEYMIPSDRIVAATYLCCAAITGGDIVVKNICPDHIRIVLEKFEDMGCKIKKNLNEIYLCMNSTRPKPINLSTMPFPGFPTDLMPIMMSISSIANGNSVYIENIFESRFRFVDGLKMLGAKIIINGRVAIIDGVPKLSGERLVCSDLHGGVAYTVAALVAEGISEIGNVRHIQRGYEAFDKNLLLLGADIELLD